MWKVDKQFFIHCIAPKPCLKTLKLGTIPCQKFQIKIGLILLNKRRQLLVQEYLSKQY